jgi:tryptophan-rich sensory protein
MGISAYLISRRESDHAGAKGALSLYRFQLMLNVLWSWAFFYLRSPLAGLAVISFLWLSILATIMKFRKISAAAAILLVPYLLWVSFATYLNYSLWRMNPDDGERIEDLDAASSRRHI